MNFYERQSLINQMDEREKVDFIHRITKSLKEYDNDPEYIKEYNALLKKADEIFINHNEFYI